MTRSLVLSGVGPYADPWHDCAATSRCLAGLLAGLGHDVQVSGDIPARLRDLDGIDLLVVNAGAGPSGAYGPMQRGIDDFLARGGGILAMHVGACGLLDLPSWPAITGAAWVNGRSTHPPVGPSVVDVLPGAHAVAAPPWTFGVWDERYVDLDLAEGGTVIATHLHEGTVHPLVWARTVGPGRVVTDTLGHGVESYDSAGHRGLLERSARWLAGESAEES